MTEPQIKALRYLATVQFATPADLGQAMGGTRRGYAQGLGRMGGSMGSRLVKMKLALDASRERHGFPAYAISAAGRAALKELDKCVSV